MAWCALSQGISLFLDLACIFFHIHYIYNTGCLTYFFRSSFGCLYFHTLGNIAFLLSLLVSFFDYIMFNFIWTLLQDGFTWKNSLSFKKHNKKIKACTSQNPPKITIFCPSKTQNGYQGFHLDPSLSNKQNKSGDMHRRFISSPNLWRAFFLFVVLP